MRGPLHVDAAAGAVVEAHARSGMGGLGSTAQKKADGRLSGAMAVWEALTGREGDDALHHAYDVLQVRVLRDEEDAAEDAALAADPAPAPPGYGMVYRCTRDGSGWSDPDCRWWTTEYAEIDAHEEPGHVVVGSMERLPGGPPEVPC